MESTKFNSNILGNTNICIILTSKNVALNFKLLNNDCTLKLATVISHLPSVVVVVVVVAVVGASVVVVG